MTPTDLRRQNLHVLLEGKGAKSALARLISLSPASVTSMLNGTKPLDKEFCNSICHALKLPENWFEHERKSGDVPEAVQKRLAPLPRGSATPTPLLNKAGAATLAAAPAAEPAAPAPGAESGGTAPAPAPMPQTWPAATGSKVSKVLRLGGGTPAAAPVAAAAPAHEPAAPPSAAKKAAPAATPAAAPAATRALAPAQVGDAPLAPVSGFIVEGGLSPITEALIKTLAQKARQGSLSEDRAFELLGSVRAL